MLATFSNYGVSSVWLTTNGGASWTEKETNLPDMPIRWAIFHPENDGQVMLATELGVWATNTLLEANTEWAPANVDMGNVRVDMLKVRAADNKVLAASHGRGLFTATYEKDVYTAVDESEVMTSALSIYPNPTSTVAHVQWKSNSFNEATLKVTDLAGKTVIQQEVSKGENQLTLDVSSWPSGTYVVRLQQGKHVQSNKLVVK
jgi:hypothetical protein